MYEAGYNRKQNDRTRGVCVCVFSIEAVLLTTSTLAQERPKRLERIKAARKAKQQVEVHSSHRDQQLVVRHGTVLLSYRQRQPEAERKQVVEGRAELNNLVLTRLEDEVVAWPFAPSLVIRNHRYDRTQSSLLPTNH